MDERNKCAQILLDALKTIQGSTSLQDAITRSQVALTSYEAARKENEEAINRKVGI